MNEAVATPAAPLVQRLHEAVAFHEEGDLPAAERIYREILALEPQHTQANFNLGVLALQQADAERARPCFLAALQSAPEREQCWLACIETLVQVQRPRAAAAVLARARQVLGASEALQQMKSRLPAGMPAGDELDEPDRMALVKWVGDGSFAAAESLARELSWYFPDNAFVWKALGVALEGLDRFTEARQALGRALELFPADAEAHGNLGNACKSLGMIDEALASYRQALELDPQSYTVTLNLAALHVACGDIDVAEQLYRKALEIDAESAEAFNGLGVVLFTQGHECEAETCYRQAISRNGLLPNPYKNLGGVLSHRGLWSEAAACFQRSLELLPNQPDVLVSLAGVQARLGRIDASIATSRKAVELAPEMGAAHGALAIGLLRQGHSAEVERCCLRLMELEPENVGVRQMRLFNLTHDPVLSPRQLFEEHRAFGEFIESRCQPLEPLSASPEEVGRPLRIGFVSGDYCAHPVAYFLEPILRHLDRRHFQAYAYSTGIDEDDITARLRELVSGWRKVDRLDDQALAALIREDRIDILFDLSGHTEGNRLSMFALKPAPLQASWIGNPATTGLSRIDYYLVDEHCAPPGLLDDQFTENLVRLPAIAAFQAVAGAPQVAVLPALSRGYLTFGSFNRMNKLNDATLDLWCRVMQAIPEARLLVGAVEEGASESLLERFRCRGIGEDRLMLRSRTGMMDYLAMHAEVDVLLDTQPFSGWTVTNHALWMGVPTLMLAGRTLAGRACIGNLRALGLDDFVAEDADGYVRKASAWSHNVEELAGIRSGLRGRIGIAGQGAHLRVVAAVELALRQMWRRHCHGESAVSFTISEDSVAGYLQQRAECEGRQPPTAEEEATLWRRLELGEYLEIESIARELSRRFPRQPLGWRLLAGALQGLARAEEVLEPLRVLADLLPLNAGVQADLGIQLFNNGMHDTAEVHLRRALELDSRTLSASLALGRLLVGKGRTVEAEVCYRDALVHAPAHLGIANALGVLLNENGRLEEADAIYREVLQTVPDHAMTLNNLGKNLQESGRSVEAESILRRALELRPEYAEAHYNLAIALVSLGRMKQAEGNAWRAVELRPDFLPAWLNLIFLLSRQGRQAEARQVLNALLEREPRCWVARSDLLFQLAHDERVPAEQLFHEHCRYGELLEECLPAAHPDHDNNRDPDRQLRIGFVSADYREHPIACFLEPILRHLDRTAFAIFAYSNNRFEDAVTRRLRALATEWRVVDELDDDALAGLIREDGIDILFDLSGHTGGNRLPMFARKPAPVQVSWIGYPATTGLRAIDYYLVDGSCAPRGMLDEQFTEKLVRLPTIAAFQPNEEAPSVNPLPALTRGYVTFGSFNRLAKISDSTLALWCRVLEAVPGSRMLLGAMEDSHAGLLRARFAAHGIDAERLQFHPHLPVGEYLALHHQVDILLDTQPFSGWTVSNHALWMGVPPLMLPGETLAGRACIGNLQALDLETFIAADADDYVRKAVEWSRQLSELDAIRVDLRARIARSGQGSHLRVVTSLGTALRQMWERWCQGGSPVGFDVEV